MDAQPRHSARPRGTGIITAGSGAEARRQGEQLLASIARTNVQLYNQLLSQHRPKSELALIRRAYELTSLLYAAAYQADGKPFVVHLVSVASTLALLGLPSDFVAAALLHNVYNNADFGDGRRRVTTPGRRRRVVQAVGEDVESLIHRFATLRVQRHLDRLLSEAGRLNDADRLLVTMDLADILEKHLDRGVLYFGQRDWVLDYGARRSEDVCVLACAVGQPTLATALRIAFEDVAGAQVPEVLRSAPERKYLRFLPPLSCRPTTAAVLGQWRHNRITGWLRRLQKAVRVRLTRT